MRQKAGSAAGLQPGQADFQQALNAYRQGSQQQTDLTSVLLKALDGKKGVEA